MNSTDPVTPTDVMTKRQPAETRSTADTARGRCLDKATELLMDWFGVNAPQADALIATWARDCHRSRRAVAHVLVHQIWQGDEAYADLAAARTLEHALRNLPAVIATGLESQALSEKESVQSR
jgi:hypothetical protein